MWFDVQAALAEIEGADQSGCESAPAPAPLSHVAQVAQVAHVARPQPVILETTPSASDPETLHDFLRSEGPHTHGAAAKALGWGATRAWQAEARLRAAGLLFYDGLGRAHLVAI